MTDNAVPELNDIRTFEVVVLDPLQIKGVVLTNGVVAVEWHSIPGREYRVEFKDNLAQPAWTPLGSNILAAGASAAITDVVGTNTQRIYRVQILP